MRAAWEFVTLLSLSNGMAAVANLTNVIDVTPTTLRNGRPKPHQWDDGHGRTRTFYRIALPQFLPDIVRPRPVAGGTKARDGGEGGWAADPMRAQPPASPFSTPIACSHSASVL